MHFAGKDGRPRPKVFKLRTVTATPGATVSLATSFAFTPVTIRRYYPGRQRVEVQVNGSILGGADVELVQE